MKLLSLLSAVPLLAFGNLAVASTTEEGLDRLYAYLLHDLDADVWGAGKGYVGAGCKGSRSGGRCSLNEFANYIQTGAASSSPVYYDLPPDYIISRDTMAYIVEAFMDKVATWQKRYGLIIPGTESEKGLRTALVDTVQMTVNRAKSEGIPYERKLQDLNMVMNQLALQYRARVNTDILAYLQQEVREVTWRTIAGAGNLLDNKSWSEIQGDRMVELYPELADPSSSLSRKTRAVLNDYYKDDNGERVPTPTPLG